MRRCMAEYQMRCARAYAIGVRAIARGGNEARVGSEAEIVVAAESNVIAAVDHDTGALGAVEHAAHAAQAARLERGEIGGEIEGHVTQKALGRRRAVSEIKALRRRDFTPHCLRLTRDFHWMHAKLVEQRAIALSFRIAGRQEL